MASGLLKIVVQRASAGAVPGLRSATADAIATAAATASTAASVSFLIVPPLFESGRRTLRRQPAVGSGPDRVPDGLQLEEGRDLVERLRIGLADDDALHVLGGGALEVGAEPVRAGDVDRVHVHVRRKPRRDLRAEPGEDVDDAAGDVARRERLRKLDRRERLR